MSKRRIFLGSALLVALAMIAIGIFSVVPALAGPSAAETTSPVFWNWESQC